MRNAAQLLADIDLSAAAFVLFFIFIFLYFLWGVDIATTTDSGTLKTWHDVRHILRATEISSQCQSGNEDLEGGEALHRTVFEF